MENIKDLILSTKGRFFTVVFLKKDGEPRVMVCRTGVKKGLTGKGMSYNPLEKNLLPVYDVIKSKQEHKAEYRMIPLDPERIVEVKIRGKTYVPDKKGNAREVH